ncbi:ergothioneine biosynthesis glutamate--cysteine ligase EgtA [Glycomyces sp. A-F 0318]|uniref:ergothioneine biosynthesis glutamate--cysteine ligase EgtA n=1 Tax=Glycomyces amatae TaxID=2881355 RepID=UPI001E4AEEC9|nr:ergothioneine biosynthesis glutamate--cysteine ligase EgtA [Glycomyces amatae]MCD0443002.1 ergothioneine biosynthesis glutamate--cysteine ligase EgtA [Glycomyces amatae]
MSDASLRDRTAAPLSEDEAFDRIAAEGFRPTAPARIGAEVEWLVTGIADRRRRVDPESLKAVLGVRGALPRRTRLSFEPGGALELSTLPRTTVRECFDDLEADRARVAAALGDEGLELLGLGLDPIRLPRRVLRSPRYQAMEELFDQDGRAGRWMMANTASVQVCLDTGDDGPGPGGLAERWDLAHRLAPVLIAAFANSPLRRGEPSLWRSTRQHVWAAIDHSRSRAVSHLTDPQGDPREAWARYALDARVMAIRGPGRWTVPRGLTFRGWIRGAGPRPPAPDDLDYHLSTLFPPVRPRGAYLELRMIDAQPGRDWVAPVAVAAALFDDPAANAAAREALEPLWRNASAADLYLRAATAALQDAPIARAAAACFRAARDAQADPEIAAVVEAFTESFVTRGRTRADDLVTEGPRRA